MDVQTPQALSFLKAMPSQDELLDGKAVSNDAPPEKLPQFNTHVHVPPNFSAFTTIEEVTGLAVQEKIELLGVSNYYDYSVYDLFSRSVRKHGIFPLFGTEIICLNEALQKDGVKVNDPGNPGKMYVCGKGITRFDPMSDTGTKLLNKIRENDSERIRQMIQKLAAVFSQQGCPVDVDEESVRDMIVRRHDCSSQQVVIQERHVAMAFQRDLFQRFTQDQRKQSLEAVLGEPFEDDPDDPVKVQNRIRSSLMKMGKPAFVPEAPISFDEARQLILELGGVPAYPVLADGTSPICPFETPIKDWLTKLENYGFHAAEFIPSRNSPEVLREYVTALRQAGFVVTAGTEHNTLAQQPFALACAGGSPIPQDVYAILWEGACVIAAHQYLSVKGDTGLVDSQGKRNPAFTGDEGIQNLRRIGENVIRHFKQS